MAYSTRTIGITIASGIAVLLIGTAVLLSGPLPFHLSRANAESTHDILVTYAAKDSDADGLPDWEEALYGTDPANPHSVSASLTDGQAVAQGLVKPKFASATTTPAVDPSTVPGVSAAPSTLTDQFAEQLFSQYLLTRDATPPSQQDIATFVEQGVTQLEQNHATPPAFNAGEVRVVGSGPDALAKYMVDAEHAFGANTVPADQSELEYFNDVAIKGKTNEIKNINAIGNAYKKIAQSLMQISVPQELAASHLELANALMGMSETTLDFGSFQTDPLRAMLGVSEYDSRSQAFITAMAHVADVYTQEGVAIPSGAAGSQLLETFQSATKVTKP